MKVKFRIPGFTLGQPVYDGDNNIGMLTNITMDDDGRVIVEIDVHDTKLQEYIRQAIGSNYSIVEENE